MMTSSGIQRNATTSTVQIPSPMRVPRVCTSEGLERAKPLRDQEIRGHDDNRDGGEGGRERHVSVDTDLLLDDVADEVVLPSTHQRRRDEVAEREREGEDGT